MRSSGRHAIEPGSVTPGGFTSPSIMTPSTTSSERVTIEGKFFQCGGSRFHVKGVTYGPFAPGEDGGHFASPEQTARDFAQIVELGANVLRVYHVPPRWVLDTASRHGLKVLIDI